MSAEKDYLASYNSADYDKPSVAVDLLIMTIENDRLKIALIKRGEHPFKGMLSLPGVFVRMDETLDEAAARAAQEETGLTDIYFEQLYTWGDISRDPRMRIISVSYLSLTPLNKLCLSAGQRTDSAALYDVEELLESDTPLAFDHRKIIEYGRERIRNKAEYSGIAFELLPNEFTLPQLQRVYEILLGRTLYKANFRRQAAALIEETDRMTSGQAHRPSRLYTTRKEKKMYNIICFYGADKPNGFLSNWYMTRFTDEDGVQYSSMEQYMMYAKAKLFGDHRTGARILTEHTPAKVKALGRQVAGFDQTIWDAHKYNIVKQGVTLKFTQNPELMEKLKAFGTNCIFAECSPRDKIWGIGLSATDPDRLDRKKWRGENLLGRAITEVSGNTYPD